MSRILLVGVLATLLLPVVALGALIFQQERGLSEATVLNVPVRGVDPRDLLKGRYLVAEFEWDWESEPAGRSRGAIPGVLCVLAPATTPAGGGAIKPRVRFVSDAAAAQAPAGQQGGERPGLRLPDTGEPQPPARQQRAAPPRPRVPDTDGLQVPVGACLMTIKGRGWTKDNVRPARFVPLQLDAGQGRVHLFVPEVRAGELERMLRDKPGVLTVDLAVRRDGVAAIKALRLDGVQLGR